MIDITSQTVKYYENLTKQYPYLSKEDEFTLLTKCIKEKCEDSRQILINSYIKTVLSLSKKFSKNNQIPMSDFIHAGILGIQTAIEKFDISKYKSINKNTGSLFGYFVYRAILKSLWDYYRINVRQFSVSDTTNTKLHDINQLYRKGLFNWKSEDEIVSLTAKELSIKEKDARHFISLFKPSVELDKPMDDSNDESNIKETLWSVNNVEPTYDLVNIDNPVDNLQNKETVNSLFNGLNSLTDDERNLICAKYGINTKKHTLSAISKKYKINPASANVKINKILVKLKNLIQD